MVVFSLYCVVTAVCCRCAIGYSSRRHDVRAERSSSSRVLLCQRLLQEHDECLSLHTWCYPILHVLYCSLSWSAFSHFWLAFWAIVFRWIKVLYEQANIHIGLHDHITLHYNISFNRKQSGYGFLIVTLPCYKVDFYQNGVIDSLLIGVQNLLHERLNMNHDWMKSVNTEGKKEPRERKATRSTSTRPWIESYWTSR